MSKAGWLPPPAPKPAEGNGLELDAQEPIPRSWLSQAYLELKEATLFGGMHQGSAILL